ncbi:TPM domain-containing protein [uncultured Microbacterium sp.]|uniref:TPM domain-containing protein n=1 Tax=uncultured Microbacterium sp. TaxID=191216 RepID=UPI0028DC0BF8|nr:TPM domain-containing protein [uncultured Microbacterium sp.]
MKTRWKALCALALATLLGVALPSTASATDPLTLDAGYVTDDAGVLSSGEDQTLEARLQELTENSSADLFVVFVDEFTSPSDRIGWADQVAVDNGLGPDQYLLAIATEQRSYFISGAEGGPLSGDRLDDIEQKIQPLLAQEDWDGAVVLAADEIQGDGGAGALRVLLVIVGVVAVALVVWLVVALVRRRRREAAIRARGAMPATPDPADPFSTMTDEQVENLAGAALVRADDAITSSREELAFAIAQFGDAATAEFTAVVDRARQKLAEAFDLRQKLDDEIEDTIHDRRAWHIRIVQIADEVDDILDDNVEAFDALRRLEQNAPQELERVKGERAALEAALPVADAALSALATAYTPGALAAVADNPAQARERAALADRAIQAASDAVAGGRSGEAAFAIRTAEQAVAQAHQLAAALTTLRDDLAAIEARAQALVAELQSDVETAAQLPDPDGSLAAAASAVRQQLEAARTDLDGPSRDPQRAFDALSAANTTIDQTIARSRENAERALRARQMLDQTLLQADSEIRTAREFIETRRGSVGSTARTRLSQAEASRAQAEAARSQAPDAALAEARRALDLARQAISSASADVSAYSSSSSGWDAGWGGGPFGGGRSNDSGLAGDILGGIIGGLLSGGGGGGSRSSRGSSWRSSGGGFRSSGFGGGGRSGGARRRSGGGRF